METSPILEWFKVISPIALLVVSALMAVAGYFAKKTVDGFAEELKAQRLDHEDLEKEFLRFQAQLPRVYVLKDDHIRHITIVEKKIDDLGNSVQMQLSDINSDMKQLLRETPKRRNDGTA